MGKSKLLIVGGSGYIGRRVVQASLAQGHPTYILLRPYVGGYNIDNLQILLSFKKQGAHLIQASLDDHHSLVNALKQVDVVICTISGTTFRGLEVLQQLKLIEAIKEAGNIKRFFPSEFGMDVARMGHALEQGKDMIIDKMKVRKAIEDAKIPFTYVSSNLFAGYFVPNLCNLLITLIPPKEKVSIFGDGNVKAVFNDEDDIGTYTIKSIDDPRTLNKTLYIRPPENILTQRQLVDMWEKLTGKELEKVCVSKEDFLATMEGMDEIYQGAVGHFYHFFYEGCLANFEIGEEGEEASKLYPEVQYTRMIDYMKIYM